MKRQSRMYGILRETLRERRRFPKGSPDFEYRTTACRKMIWWMRDIPTSQWDAMEAAL